MTKKENPKGSAGSAARRSSGSDDANLTYEQKLERFDRRQTRVRVGLLCLLFGTAGFFFWRNANYEPPAPDPNFSGYYAGPWVNKNGDLVSEDGKILRNGYGVPAAGPSHNSASARRLVPTPVISSGMVLEP